MTKADRALRLVALFKFTKSVTLLVTGLGALRLLDPDFATRAVKWSAALSTEAGRRLLGEALAWAVGLPPSRLEILGISALLYSALFITEGVGLWLGRRWAEYLTLIATASFVPLEAIELARRPTVPRIAAVALNLAVVAYLWGRVRAAPSAGASAGARRAW